MTTADARPASAGYATHDVMNQPVPLTGYDAFSQDRALVEAVHSFGAGWASSHLARSGVLVGSDRVQQLARSANRYPPELRTHDRFGNRIDVVEYHPAYHELMSLTYGEETHSFAWRNPQSGAHVARAALSYLWNQGENGICCPMVMNFAAIPALRHASDLLTQWTPALTSPGYDPRPVPASEKQAVTIGMAMTEKQGGSDLRANTTHARPATDRHGSGAEYLLTGHKWFFSAPMSDLFLTLAHTDKGLSCFLAAGWLPDGRRNRLKIQRLKEKCGNRSNASSEVEFYDLEAVMVGEEGRGIATIIEMAHYTRMDMAAGSAGLMRQALSQAINHTSHRRAFQRSIVDQPMMRNVLTDLAIESEAMMWMSLRVARALDRSAEDPAEALLMRLGTPIAKYWATKRAVPFVAEAMECHGGAGFVADHFMERLYREAPLNGIWEGSGNVVCLDVLRALNREPAALAAFMAEVETARGADRRFDAFVESLKEWFQRPAEFEANLRRIVEAMACALQASLLLRYAPHEVADMFCGARLAGDWRGAYGTLASGTRDQQIIIERARLHVDYPSAA